MSKTSSIEISDKFADRMSGLSGREAYRVIFRPDVFPNFTFTRLVAQLPKDAALIDQYDIKTESETATITILKSKDLVNWEYCSNALLRFDFSKCYDLDSCNRYGHGQWATSMKYHNGKFYLLFITLDEGGFMCTSDKAEGPWKITHLPKGFYDAGLFFDDDGKVYMLYGNRRLTLVFFENTCLFDANFVCIKK
jgi:hypothetical protein